MVRFRCAGRSELPHSWPKGWQPRTKRGLVHRDLKPENIKMSSDGFVKILDFGLAKRVSADLQRSRSSTTGPRSSTIPGVILGTVGYMSPEQAGGGRVEFCSDQFSFGAGALRDADRASRVRTADLAETLSAIIREEPQPPSRQLEPGGPPPVRWIVERCLAKDPQERYVLTRDLARELASVREHLSELPASRRGRTAGARLET